MRRTTICRSSSTVMAAVLLAATAGSAAAQRGPTIIQRPIEQAQRAAAQTNANTAAQQNVQESNQPNAPATTTPATSSGSVVVEQGGQGGAAAQAPETHTVAQGETLWSLAQQFLGDPLLWPEIYRLNTGVVEDPHWIYPGEELRLQPGADTGATVAQAPAPAAAPADTTPAAAPAPDIVVDQNYAAQAAQQQANAQQAAPVSSGRTVFFPQGGSSIRTPSVQIREAQAYRAVRAGEFYSSGFLTEGQPLHTGRVAVNASTTVLGNIITRQSTSYLEDAVVDEPPGDTLQPGDLLLSFTRGDEIPGYGDIIQPTGMLRVVGPMGNRYRATVIEVYDQINSQQEFIKVAPFVFNSSRHAEPVTDGIQGEVIALSNPRTVVVRNTVVFINKGADDGVRLGDVFQILASYNDPERGGTLEQDQGRALVVNVRSRSATAVLVELYRSDVRPGSLARQVRRMPS